MNEKIHRSKSLKRKLAILAIAAALASTTASADPQSGAEESGIDSRYVGLGVGSAAGALLAGPTGLVVGGLIGTLVGRDQAQPNDTPDAARAEVEPTTPVAATRPVQSKAAQTEPQNGATQQLASARTGMPADALPDTTRALQQHSRKLAGILAGGMGIDVFFKSGSVAVDPYFEARLQAVAELADAMPGLRVRLDGYSDRRGPAGKNLELSRARLDAVREKLIAAGVAQERIDVHARGEKRFISAPGDLEAYTFDRRVVVRFEPAAAQDESPLAAVDPVRAF